MKIKVKFLLILFLCLVCSGCWNYNELNELAIVTGMGIDKTEDGIKVSLMISNSQSTQGSTREGEAQTTVFSGTGKNITEALEEIDVQNPRNLYLGHLSVAVVDEEIAREDISIITDALLRNPETAKKYYLILARDNKAEEILKSLSPLEFFPSQNISLNIQNSSKSQGIISDTKLSEFVINLLDNGVSATMPSISIKGNSNKIDNQEDLKETKPNATLETRSIGIFKDFKLVAWTTREESQGINIINNKIDRLYITNEFENDEQVVVLIDSVKTKVNISNDKTLLVKINTKTKGAIVETNTDFNLKDTKVIEKINRKTEENMKKIIEKAIKVAKENHSDIFGFGNMLYKKDYKYFNKIKSEWHDTYFPNLEVEVDVDVSLKSKGSLETTLKEELDER